MGLFGKNKKANKGAAVGAVHIEGLPLPASTDVMVAVEADGLHFTASTNQQFDIDMAKITGVYLKTDEELQQYTQQSLPGMVLGAATFGVLGAIVGGRVQTKEKRVVHHFMLICYNSDGPKTIVLETTKDWYNAAKLIDAYKAMGGAATPVRVSL